MHDFFGIWDGIGKQTPYYAQACETRIHEL